MGVDSLAQQKAMSEEMVYIPRTDENQDANENEEKNTDSDTNLALSNLLGNLIGFFTAVTIKDWLHTG